jgi:hypothetical protein
MTKREMFVAIANVAEVASNAEMVDFLNHQIELLDSRKSSGSKGLTKTQKENASIKAVILEVLAEQDHAVTISEMLKDERLNGYSNQKMSALLRQMGEDGTKEVRKIRDKKVSRFEIAETDDDAQFLDREVTV